MAVSLERAVEAILFASGRFLDAKTIAELLDEKPAAVRKAAKSLQEQYEQRETALQLMQEDDAFKLHVKSDYLEVVSKVVSDTEVSGPVLETLAVIAWRSPAVQAEVVEKRGSNAYEHIKELVERGFIKKEPLGRTYRLRITEKFFDYFDVEGRNDIRQMFKEVEEEYRKKEMELELEQKRIQEAIAKAEGEEGPQEELEIPEEKLSDRKVSLDDMDAILEKSQKTRENVGKDLDALKGDKEDEDPDEALDELAEDVGIERPHEEPEQEDTLEKAKEIREKVEKDIEEMSK